LYTYHCLFGFIFGVALHIIHSLPPTLPLSLYLYPCLCLSFSAPAQQQQNKKKTKKKVNFSRLKNAIKNEPRNRIELKATISEAYW